MGDNSNSCRGFETPTLGSDIWPMGFDVDLALDGPGARKGPGNSLGCGLGNGGLNSLQSTGNSTVSGGYNDIHHLSGLSSILQRFDDLHAGDICQMTDLTNSLPKGDSETAQSLLAKLACQDLEPDLPSGADPSHKDLETSLFDHAAGGMSHGTGGSTQGVVLSHKTPLESAEVYGRMTCYSGKLVLQLRHINCSTNYTLNVSECWLCGEKVNAGSQLCSHKHSLNGLFQVNDEFVQMDIDHYIIPEQALDPPDSHDVTDSVLQHSDSTGLHHNFSTTRELELAENLTGGGDGLNMGADGPTLHYTAGPETGLVPPLSSGTPSLLTQALPTNHNSCLNSSAGQLPLPGMPITSNHPGINSSRPIPGMSATANLSQAPQPLCLASTPMFGLTHTDPSSANAMLLPPHSERKVPTQNCQTSVTNNYTVANGLNSFGMNNQMSGGSVQGQHNLRETATRNKHASQYHLPFANSGEYSCHASINMDVLPEKHAEAPSLTPLHSVSSSFDSRLQKAAVVPRKAEIGAKKRKSKAQKKPSVIQMREYNTAESHNVPDNNINTTPFDSLTAKMPVKNMPVKNEGIENRSLVKPEVSLEEWIDGSLPESNLITTENQNKTGDGQFRSLSVNSDQKTPKKITEKPQKHPVDHLKSREPDQTSRLAAHMLTKGLDMSCRLCAKCFGKDVRNYKIHMSKHGIEDVAFFACSFCTKTFAKVKHYRQHLKTHVRTRRFSCRWCSASYSREGKLRRHMKSHSQTQEEREHKCPKCPKSFNAKEYLQNHLKLVHSGKKYKCETCGFLCSSPFNLDTHIKKHSGDKPFKCELCEKTFVRRDFLDNHMEQKHKNKKSKCEVCNKVFSRKDVLKRHLAVHNNETHDCDICFKKFSRKDRLVVHKKLHRSESDYKCLLCPASYTRKNSLDRHEKVHKTKEQCKVCYKFFLNTQRLENHVKLHEKNSSGSGRSMVKCEVCNKSLTNKDILRKHMRKIHGKLPEKKKKVEAVEREKKFVCRWCSKRFTRSCNLSAHHLKAHSKDADEDDFDDFPSVLQSSKQEHSIATRSTANNPSSSAESILNSTSYGSLSASSSSSSSSSHSTITSVGMSGSGQSSVTSSSNHQFLVSIPASSPSQTHHPPPLQLSSHFPSSGPPDSPINLSTDAITAAAYLLAYPSYPGPY